MLPLFQPVWAMAKLGRPNCPDDQGGQEKMQRLTGVWASAGRGHLWHPKVSPCSTTVPTRGLIILRGTCLSSG